MRRVTNHSVRHSNILIVTTGHSHSKNGVASLAYDQMVHAEPPHGLLLGSLTLLAMTFSVVMLRAGGASSTRWRYSEITARCDYWIVRLCGR